VYTSCVCNSLQQHCLKIYSDKNSLKKTTNRHCVTLQWTKDFLKVTKKNIFYCQCVVSRQRIVKCSNTGGSNESILKFNNICSNISGVHLNFSVEESIVNAPLVNLQSKNTIDAKSEVRFKQLIRDP
jgi:hypothetical protein